MAKRAFSLEHILYCAAAALGRQGGCSSPPNELHEFLTGQAPSWGYLEGFEVTAVTCGLILLDQHPRLKAAVEKSLKTVRPYQDAFEDGRSFQMWLANQEKTFGKTLEVETLSPGTLRKFATTARDIALRNLEAKGVDLTQEP